MDIEDIEHRPDEPDRHAGEAPEGSSDEPTEEEERAWQQALLRARTEFADEDTDVGLERPQAEPVAAEPASPAALRAGTSPLPPPRRKRRTSRPESALPAQTVTVRRQRQTGRMDLVVPAGLDTPPVDLAPAADPAPPAAPPPARPPAPPAASAPSAASAVARVLADGAARARERSREREALERVLAMAKPRSRHPQNTPAVLPPQDDDED